MSRFDDRYLNYGDVYSIIMQAKTIDQAMNVLHLPYVEMPKRDAEPKKGRWVERAVYSDNKNQWQSARCSACNKYHTTPYLYYFDFDDWNYCPYCGAKMEVTE